MKNSNRSIPQVAILFIFGILGLINFSEGVRGVDVVGLSGSGFALGVGLVLLILSFRGKIKP